MRTRLTCALVALGLAASSVEARELDQSRLRSLKAKRDYTLLRGPRVASLGYYYADPDVAKAGSGGGGSGASAWGDITGTLSDQTDLQSALDAKPDLGDPNVWTGVNTFGAAAAAANSIALNETAGCITWEGLTADTIQGRLCVTDPTVSDKTWTLPNSTGTVALVEVNNSFTVAQTLQTGIFGTNITLVANSGLNLSATNGFVDWGATIGGINARAAPTPDTLEFYTGTASEAIHVLQLGDVGFDHQNGPCGTSVCTDPTFIVRSHNQATGEFTATQAGALTTRISKALTEAGGAEVAFQITLATTQMTGGEVFYTVRATDATDLVARNGSVKFVTIDAAGAVTATLSGASEAADGSVLIATGGATLTYAITADVATANVFKLAFNIDSSLVVSAASIDYLVILTGPGAVTPQ